MNDRPNILVVCGRNKRRSRTAEYIFKNDQRFNIRSVGLSPKSERQIKERDIEWSDLIFVMEDGQGNRISGAFRHLEIPEIEVLQIEDEYEYLDEELIEMLTDRINSTLGVIYNI
ncbi:MULTISPECIES: protein-tyrosine-phosphatase [Algoriphagus]|uniref:Protein-tyrosine phosphatase n=2 Tax=Algoriphagus TaxID=246875 RepID=A0A1I1A4I7_9BACT|nr:MULTISPECIES: protein-tyrosine-phosphatase [Algoriphagus]PZX46327.1 protein-tyrosine phosphatase [Algoriphagus chordae]SFB32855.1 protein-tyrosine phosphatase [Algoriphagus aquimarinus]